MKRQLIAVWFFLTATVFFLGACGGGSDGGSSSNDIGTGTLAVSLVDAPGDYKAVYVTIKEVQVCAAPAEGDGEGEDRCEWLTVGSPNATYDLLELVNGVMEELGQDDLPAGTYNQLRLLLACPDIDLEELWSDHPFPNYLKTEMDDNPYELKVPSGCRSGIKLVHPFDIAAGGFTELILDFDVARSVVHAGNSGKYLLKPTIKVIGTHNYMIVSGTVRNVDGDEIEGASVTAWQDVALSSPAASTFTDINGGYQLYLDPGVFTIVVTAPDYKPHCEEREVYSTQVVDFSLNRAESTTQVEISGTVTLQPGFDPPLVKVSFLQNLSCNDAPVEVVSKTFASSESMEPGVFRFWSLEDAPVSLPSGFYFVKAQTIDGQHTWGPMERTLEGPLVSLIDINF